MLCACGQIERHQTCLGLLRYLHLEGHGRMIPPQDLEDEEFYWVRHEKDLSVAQACVSPFSDPWLYFIDHEGGAAATKYEIVAKIERPK